MRISNPFLKLLFRRKPILISPTMNLLSRPKSSMLRSQSEDNLNKIGDCMENMDEDVSKLFIEFQQTDLREDPELFCLLNHYFSTSKSVSQLCESVRMCLRRAEKNECILLDEAIRDFEKEKLGFGEARFRQTFRDVRNFNGFYNNSSDEDYCEFLEKFRICHEELAKMIVKLEKTMKKIDQKLRRVRGRRAIFTAALLAPVIIAIFVTKIVAGVFGLVPMEALTSFVASRWKKTTESLKREKTAVSSMERGTIVALKELEKISRLVSRLETVERSIRETAEFAVEKRSSVFVAMGEVEEERKMLKSTLVDLDRETGLCHGFAQFGRTVALEKITEFLSRGQKSSK